MQMVKQQKCLSAATTLCSQLLCNLITRNDRGGRGGIGLEDLRHRTTTGRRLLDASWRRTCNLKVYLNNSALHLAKNFEPAQTTTSMLQSGMHDSAMTTRLLPSRCSQL